MEVATNEPTAALTSPLIQLGTTRTPQLDHNPNASCPILKLHHDILLEIFQINADMDQDPPLQKNRPITRESPRAINTTLNTSQVSSRWRNLLLDSPRVWADLIDLHALESAGEYWREEVIRRAQNCPLSLKGSISPLPLGSPEPWWLRFFNDDWTRMRKVDLVIKTINVEALLTVSQMNNDGEFSQMNCGDEIVAARGLHRQVLHFLARPTFTLESLRIIFPHKCDLVRLGITLFDEHAPRLQHFQCQNLLFDPRNSWILQLRTLHVHENDPKKTFRSADDLYHILSRMPFLESLSIVGALELTTDTDVCRATIHLPRLRYLNIRGRSRMGLSILRASQTIASVNRNLLTDIIPRHDCSVRAVLVLHPSRGLDFQNTICRLAENYFKAYAPTYLELSADRRQFNLTVLRAPKQIVVDTPIAPFFECNFYNPVYSNETALSDIFEALFFLSFPKVVELCLEIGHSQSASLSNPQFGQLLSSFSSMEKLTTTPETLRLLRTSPNVDITTVFPMLKLLQMPLDIPGGDYETHIPLSDILLPFLMDRKAAGVPVAAFYYECTSVHERMEDLRFLENVAGLNVIWESKSIGNGEYICGSGRPDELDFLEKWSLRGFSFRR